MSKKPEEQEPWWKRQEREARERNRKLKDGWKEEKQQKQILKEEQERLEEEQDKRPQSIKNFEAAYLLSLFIELQIYVRYPEMRPEVEISIFLQLGILLFVYGSIAILCLLASRKRSNIAKWIIVIISGFSILSFTLQISEITSGLVSLNFLEISQTARLFLECIAIVFAFTRESRIWFRKESPVKETSS